MKYLCYLWCLSAIISCSNGDEVLNRIASNESAAERYMQAINDADTAVLREIIAPDFKRLTSGVADLEGVSEMQEFVLGLKENNPGFAFEIVQIAAGLSDIGIFWKASSPNPAGGTLSWTGANVLSVNDDGKLLTERVVGDRLGMMEQLGYRMIKMDENDMNDPSLIHPGVK